MLLPCRYYTANTRLFAGIGAMSKAPGFWFCCLRGSMVENKGVYRATSSHITVMVNCLSDIKKPVMAVLTTDPLYEQYGGGKIDTDIIRVNNFYMSLCTLLKDKYSNTANPFTLTLACEGSTVDVDTSTVDGEAMLRATIKIPTGEAIVSGDTAVTSQLKTVTAIRSFRYCTVNPAVEKEVIVRKCYGEILREIAHYLNRTLVMISQTIKGEVVEQYVSAQGCAEVVTRSNGTKVYKRVSAASLQELNVLSVHTTTAMVDDVLRDYGKALKK